MCSFRTIESLVGGLKQIIQRILHNILLQLKHYSSLDGLGDKLQDKDRPKVEELFEITTTFIQQRR